MSGKYCVTSRGAVKLSSLSFMSAIAISVRRILVVELLTAKSRFLLMSLTSSIDNCITIMYQSFDGV